MLAPGLIRPTHPRPSPGYRDGFLKLWKGQRNPRLQSRMSPAPAQALRMRRLLAAAEVEVFSSSTGVSFTLESGVPAEAARLHQKEDCWGG